MTAKNLDEKGRWRSRYVGFRMSPEEDEHLETIIKLCGMSKQAYIIDRLLDREIVVKGTSRVSKALRNQLLEVLEELKRIEAGSHVDDEMLDTIRMIARIVEGLEKNAN